MSPPSGICSRGVGLRTWRLVGVALKLGVGEWSLSGVAEHEKRKEM